MPTDNLDGRRPCPGKRFFDVVSSGLALVVLSPLLAVVAILVRRTSPGPALYRAPRVGRGGALFTMYKFRSMYVTPPDRVQAHTTALNDPRVTRLGQTLRRFKLDELPQLFNVLRGDMSIVGPRPEVEDCVALYTPEQRQILTVRPGMTDLASVEFANLQAVVGESEDPHQVYLDRVFGPKNDLRLQYVQKANWSMDLAIIGRTLFKLFTR